MSRAAHSLLPLALVAALLPLSGARAQVAAAAPSPAPGAGDILRDVPVEPTMPKLPEVPPLSAPAADAAPTAAASFVLRRFEVQGMTAFRPAQIAALADPYIGKTMTDADLGALIGALRKRYEDAGYGLAGVGFPSQDVTSGVLKVEVLEPRLARIQIPLGADAPLSEARVQGLLSLYCLHTGGLLNTQALERVMFALNDTPGVQAKAKLSPAGDEGVYNLSIEMQPRRSWDASLVLDNQGIRSSGRWRLTGVGRLNNPLGIGDNLDVQTLFSSGGGVRVGRIAYELPVGYTPARFSVAFAKVGYNVGGQFESYDPKGTARVAEANLSYPLIRSRTRTLMARLGFESKNLTDELGAFGSRSDKRILGTTAGLNYESRDRFLGGGFNGASAILHWGDLKLKNDWARIFDGQGIYQTAGKFGRAELQYSRLQKLVGTTSLYASVSQQVASRNLDSAEKMTLGGPRGVRAYPSAEGASDEGTLLNSELRWWLNPNWTVFALYDWGMGHKRRDVAPADAAGNDVYLHGTGLGVSASYPAWATVKATVAWRGSRLPETETGNSKVRLFVQAQHTF